MVAWATPEQVKDITGAVINETDIAIAQGIVDLHASIESEFVDLETMWPKDISRLKKAVSYQAKFMDSQVEVLGRQDVKGVSQDGVSATFNTVDSVALAPLARKAIEQLSWKRPRGLRARRRYGQGALALQQTWVRDAEPGSNTGWTPVKY
jgi:hypothetical protein